QLGPPLARRCAHVLPVVYYAGGRSQVLATPEGGHPTVRMDEVSFDARLGVAVPRYHLLPTTIRRALHRFLEYYDLQRNTSRLSARRPDPGAGAPKGAWPDRVTALSPCAEGEEEDRTRSRIPQQSTPRMKYSGGRFL